MEKPEPITLFSLMWSRADVIGLFSINVVSFSRNVVLKAPLFSLNLVPKTPMLSVRTVYVLGSLHLPQQRKLPTFLKGGSVERERGSHFILMVATLHNGTVNLAVHLASIPTTLWSSRPSARK